MSKRHQRHPAEVTCDRLGDITDRYGDKLSGEECDMIGRIRFALEEIAEGKR